jgi:predicted TIM-barrel fold metal-dependent hydrolase
MYIDFHTHIFPRRKAPAVLHDLSAKKGIPHFADGTLHGLLRSMEHSTVDLSLISRITTRKDNVAAVNRWLLGCARPGVRPMATVHPDSPVSAGDLEEMKRQGFTGVKLHPDYQGFFADDPRMYPFYEAAQATQMPVLFHAGLDRGLPPPVHAMPSELLKVHRRFPDMIMVAAHMGGENNYEETEAHLLGEAIHLDTSFVLRIMPPEILRRFFSRHPIERILFGSDSPFTDQATEFNFLLDLPFLTTSQKEKVAGGNAAAILV